jgi:hypothetical protein
MAQSWLRLAEHAERIAPAPGHAAVEADQLECVALAPEQIVDRQRAPAPDGPAAESQRSAG